MREREDLLLLLSALVSGGGPPLAVMLLLGRFFMFFIVVSVPRFPPLVCPKKLPPTFFLRQMMCVLFTSDTFMLWIMTMTGFLADQLKGDSHSNQSTVT